MSKDVTDRAESEHATSAVDGRVGDDAASLNTAEPDYIDGDGQAFWDGPIDVRADTTGGAQIPAAIYLDNGRSWSVGQAEQIARDLLAAVAFCRAKES